MVIREQRAKPAQKAGFFKSLGWENIMVYKFDSRSDKQTNYVRILFAGCILIALVLMLMPTPAYAAQDLASGDRQSAQTDPTCTPPNDWGQTTRLLGTTRPSKHWSFTVEEPEMTVNLVFFYYQDHTKVGCPKDCSADECQTDETGNGQTPFEEFSVIDGKEGANRGSKQFSGHLTKGTYQVTFTANGNPGSINVGLQVRQEAVPTATATPTNTPIPSGITPTATNTPVTPEPTIITPEPVDTATPTTKPKRTPPATLPPPTPFPGSPPPQALIPQTGFELGQTSSMLLLILVPLSIGLIGLGITFYGISQRLKEK